VKTQKSIGIKLLGKEFQVSCPDGQEAALFKTAEYLNTQMQQVSSTSKIVAIDKIAVMAALNIANDLLALKVAHESMTTTLNEKLNYLNDKLNSALNQKGVASSGGSADNGQGSSS
jgi:cell division protein ZapA